MLTSLVISVALLGGFGKCVPCDSDLKLPPGTCKCPSITEKCEKCPISCCKEDCKKDCNKRCCCPCGDKCKCVDCKCNTLTVSRGKVLVSLDVRYVDTLTLSKDGVVVKLKSLRGKIREFRNQYGPFKKPVKCEH